MNTPPPLESAEFEDQGPFNVEFKRKQKGKEKGTEKEREKEKEIEIEIESERDICSVATRTRSARLTERDGRDLNTGILGVSSPASASGVTPATPSTSSNPAAARGRRKAPDSESGEGSSRVISRVEEIPVGTLFGRLPMELVVMVFQYLTPSEVTQVALVSVKFSRAARVFFASLRSLHLAHFHSNQHLANVSKACPRLEHVNAYHSLVDHHGFGELSRSLSHLKDLRISERHQNSRLVFQDPQVARLVKKMFVIATNDVTETDRVSLEDLPLLTNASELSLYRFLVQEPLRFGCPPTNLRLLMCSFRMPPGVAPFEESDLVELKRLNFHSCKEFDGSWLHLFANCQMLEDFNIHGTTMTDDFLRRVTFPRLKNAHFGAANTVSLIAMAEFVRRHIAQLSSLSLVRVGDFLLDQIGSFETQLTYLSLEGGEGLALSRAKLSSFLLRCSRLTRLELACIPGVTKLICAERFFQQLEVLELCKLPDFDSPHVERIIAKAPNLKILALHFPNTLMLAPIKIASPTLQSVSLRIKLISSLTLGNCPKLNSLLAKFPESLETPGVVDVFRMTGSCPNLRIVIAPSRPQENGNMFWSPLITSIKTQMAPNMMGLDCNYHQSLPALVRSLKVPYILCYNCTDINFAFFETFCALSEQLASWLPDFLKPVSDFQQDEQLRREKVSFFRTLTEGQWRVEWFATNVRSFANLLKQHERNNLLNIGLENQEVYDYLRIGFKRRRFFLVSMIGPNTVTSPFSC